MFKNISFALLIFTFLFPITAYAKWFTLDGDSYTECMENRRNEITNKEQRGIASQYCQSKFPDDYRRLSNYDYRLANIFEIKNDMGLNTFKLLKLKDSSITNNGKNIDLTVENRNPFNIYEIVIGVPISGKNECPQEKEGYQKFFLCGNRNPLPMVSESSKTFACDTGSIEKSTTIDTGDLLCFVGYSVFMNSIEFEKIAD